MEAQVRGAPVSLGPLLLGRGTCLLSTVGVATGDRVGGGGSGGLHLLVLLLHGGSDVAPSWELWLFSTDPHRHEWNSGHGLPHEVSHRGRRRAVAPQALQPSHQGECGGEAGGEVERCGNHL